jgi:hypothetical protein
MKTDITFRIMGPVKEGMTTYLADVLRAMDQQHQSPYEAVMQLQRQEGRGTFADVIDCALDDFHTDTQEKDRQEKENKEWLIYSGAVRLHTIAKDLAEQYHEFLSIRRMKNFLEDSCGLRGDDITAGYDKFCEIQQREAEKRAQGMTPQGATQYASSTVGV